MLTDQLLDDRRRNVVCAFVARPNGQGLAAALRALANATEINAGTDSKTQKS